MKARFSLLLCSLLLSSCGGREESATTSTAGGASTAAAKTITIRGSDTMVILGQRFAEEYMKKNPNITIQVNGGGSGTGIAALINGTVDLAQSSRPMKDKEKNDVQAKRNTTLHETPVALDALAVFVNARNPVGTLTLKQLEQIYTGKVTNWQQIGGRSAPIVLYGRENSSGTYEYFKEHVLNKGDFAPRVQTLAGTAAVINAVSRDVNGIGYGGIAFAQDVKALAIQGEGAGAAVAPNMETVRDGSYPISRRLFLYWVETAPAELKEFVRWTTTPEAQQLVENAGYFPLATSGEGTSTGTETTTTTGTTGTSAGS